MLKMKKIRRIVKSAALKNQRLLFVILGSSGFQQIPILHQLLSKVNKRDITTLWYSKEGSPIPELEEEEQYDSNSEASDKLDFKPLPASYDNLERISHQAVGMVILQDVDSSSVFHLNVILPTVRKGGAVVLLLPVINNLEELQHFSWNKTGSSFCKRFVQSFNMCANCIVVDENLKLLSSSKIAENLNENMMIPSASEKIEALVSLCQQDKTMTTLLNMCLTADQAELLFKFLDALRKRTLRSVISASSSYGRGKSAALGLAVAGALAMNYSNVFVSSSSHRNVDILFRFLLKGLDALGYKEDKDYDLIESANPKFEGALIGLNVFRDYKQSVRFIFPEDVGQKLEQAELVVIDEAASIPFRRLKHMMGPYIVLMASTTSGALSTSPYLYKQMVESIQNSSQLVKENVPSSLSLGNSLKTVTLTEPIHYASDDAVEAWSNHVFCLDAEVSSQLSSGCPETQLCQLYCISREVLFGGGAAAEKLLQSLVSIFNQSNYAVKPEEILNLADSNDYKIFVLLPPLPRNSNRLSLEVLCAILVHVENNIPLDVVQCGCNVPKPVPTCFNLWNAKTYNMKLSTMRGLHIVNLATHPQYKRMGYGLRALQLLKELYEGKMISLEEKMEVNSEAISNLSLKQNSPLLLQLSELKLEPMDFIVASFNLAQDVFSFWKKAEFAPVYMTADKDSEKMVCFMVKSLNDEFHLHVKKNVMFFRSFFMTLLSSHCHNLPAQFALGILNSCQHFVDSKDLTKEEVDCYLRPYHMKSLDKYCLRLQDLNTVIHVIPILAQLYFKNLLKNVQLPIVQEAILLSCCMQFKSIDCIAKEMDLQRMQVIGLLNRTIKKITKHLSDIIEKDVESSFKTADVEMKPLVQGLDEELEEAAMKVQKQQEKLLALDVSKYVIKGSEDEWKKALFEGRKTLVSIKSIKKNENSANTEREKKPKHHKKPNKKRKV